MSASFFHFYDFNVRHHLPIFLLIQNKNFFYVFLNREKIQIFKKFYQKKFGLRRLRKKFKHEKIYIWQIKFFVLFGRINSSFDHLQIT